LKTICTIKTSIHIPGLPHISDEHGKTSDDSRVLVFTKEGVNVFKEEDVLITCKGEPILISI
jgi:hypothetical protein